jgi:hypothetical protein
MGPLVNKPVVTIAKFAVRCELIAVDTSMLPDTPVPIDFEVGDG